MGDYEVACGGTPDRFSDLFSVRIGHLQTVLAQQFHDLDVERHAGLGQDLANHGRTHFVAALGIKINFVDRPAGSQYLDLHATLPLQRLLVPQAEPVRKSLFPGNARFRYASPRADPRAYYYWRARCARTRKYSYAAFSRPRT